MSWPVRTRHPQFRIVTAEEVAARRLCSGCVHGYLGDAGVFCRLLSEQIDNERVAETCELFEGKEGR